MPLASRPLAMSAMGLPGPFELRLMSSCGATRAKLLFHLMDVAMLSSEIEAQIGTFFDRLFKREDWQRSRPS